MQKPEAILVAGYQAWQKKFNRHVKRGENSVLVVDAVCDTFICNDAVITSELTVKFNDDKSFKYMGNKILNNGTKEVPKYQYRIKRKN